MKAELHILMAVGTAFVIFACTLQAETGNKNSAHAFAAYLIITRNSEEYASYLDGKDTHFATREAKLNRMRAELDTLKSRDLLQKIQASFGPDSQISN